MGMKFQKIQHMSCQINTRAINWVTSKSAQLHAIGNININFRVCTLKPNHRSQIQQWTILVDDTRNRVYLQSRVSPELSVTILGVFTGLRQQKCHICPLVGSNASSLCTPQIHSFQQPSMPWQ
jgi:hypothetical protein